MKRFLTPFLGSALSGDEIHRVRDASMGLTEALTED